MSEEKIARWILAGIWFLVSLSCFGIFFVIVPEHWTIRLKELLLLVAYYFLGMAYGVSPVAFDGGD